MILRVLDKTAAQNWQKKLSSILKKKPNLFEYNEKKETCFRKMILILPFYIFVKWSER